MIEMDLAQKMLRGHEYVEALEEERRKIHVFERELPLCLELVTQAIEACKKEISGGSTTADYVQGKSDCSEQTTSDVPVLEEFIPIKRSSDCSREDDEQESHKSKEKNVPAAVDHKRRSDWLRSVQLWNNNNQSPDLSLNEENGGAIQAIQREKTVEKNVKPSAGGKANASATSTSTTESRSRGGGGEANNGNSSKKDEKEGQTQRKTRRCWLPELHRRFLHALQQLGGSHAATPKQIRELMKVNGLTNDEVKSHLQIAHEETESVRPTQRQSTSTSICGGRRHMDISTGISQDDHNDIEKNSHRCATSGIYTPVATLPTLPQPCGTAVQRQQQSHSEERGSHSEGRVHSTSSSTHTTTDSPAY
ncbi:Myb-like transcription factor family protein, putative isoform 2 [Hibiscus syriacus]|uniref:Myb-like transcription factor family protein, putative isoform 2 n=1 Tax=Hibiscus syriacus TaxID=106335 RepID=A0A6A3BG75_HIBSY|nr:Myb-like transcription factor family protein, putative isoform 2 [Hibiscus syriacus]